jgi:hypothetical protein
MAATGEYSITSTSSRLIKSSRYTARVRASTSVMPWSDTITTLVCTAAHKPVSRHDDQAHRADGADGAT